MNGLAAPPIRPLLTSALLSVFPALLLVTGLAVGIGKLFRLSPSYAGQCLLVFGGLLLFLSPFLYQHLPLANFGAANRVTLLRAGIVALVAGLIGQAGLTPNLGWFVAGLAGFTLLLDGVDGWVARRWHCESDFGARFDMELDAFLILVLCVHLLAMGKAGPWVLAIGAMRYAFVAAMQPWPWLERPLPESRRRKLVCVWQVASLLVCLLPVIAGALATMLLALALALLAWSFAVDVRWLYRSRPRT